MNTLIQNGLSGRIAVVTGGANGIGHACAQLLGQLGVKVIIIDVDSVHGAAFAAKTGSWFYEADIADNTALKQLALEIEHDVGPVELLINAAGVLQTSLPKPEDLSLDVFDRLYELNFKGSYRTCVEFGSRMVKRRSGAIVNIASIAGMQSTPLHAYGPLKAAIIRMGEGLAAAWGRYGVRVNTISPGSVLTPGLQQAVDRGERDVNVMRQATATGEIVRIEDVARTAAFLLSDNAAAITGVNLPVDAGWLIANSWASFGGLPAIDDVQIDQGAEPLSTSGRQL